MKDFEIFVRFLRFYDFFLKIFRFQQFYRDLEIFFGNLRKVYEIFCRDSPLVANEALESLLARNNSVSLHQRNLQLLLVEIFKTKENLNPSFMKDIFVERTENYNLRSGNTLQLPKARTTTYGIESVSFLGSLLWHALPESLKKSENLAVFKRKLRSWNGLDCKCRLCKIYIADLGYL